MDPAAAARLLEKLRHFIRTELDEDERALLGSLIAPGVAHAYAATDDDVEGFGVRGWTPTDLPRALVDELYRAGVRVEGLGL
jgi:hypothetical protein